MKMTCIACGGQPSFLLRKDGFDIYECPSCKLSFVHPMPAPTFLASEVYSAKSGYQSNKKVDLSVAKPVRKHRKVIEYLARVKPGSFLDIGCSNGEMMYQAQKLGYSVKGVELNSRTADLAKVNGFDVTNGRLEDAHFVPQSFDYVYMGDLIEHVTDPQALLAEVARIIKPGGQIIIITPNMDCFWAKTTFGLWRLFKIPWSSITPPHHLWQFSRDNLRELLAKNGFDFKTVWYTGTPRLMYELGSMHLWKRYKQKRSIGNAIFMGVSFALHAVVFALNRFIELIPGVKEFSMTMVAVKK